MAFLYVKRPSGSFKRDRTLHADVRETKHYPTLFYSITKLLFINFQRLFKNLFLQEIITMLFLVSEFMIYYVHLYRNVVKLIDFNHYKTTYFLFNQVETHCSFSYKAKQVRNVYWEKSFARFTKPEKVSFSKCLHGPKNILWRKYLPNMGVHFIGFLDNEIIHQLFQSERIR